MRRFVLGGCTAAGCGGRSAVCSAKVPQIVLMRKQNKKSGTQLETQMRMWKLRN